MSNRTRRLRHAQRIIAEACRHLQVAEQRLRSRARDPQTAQARQLVCFLLVQAGYSITEVGHLLARDHSTVVHALTRVERSPSLAEQGRELVECVLPFIGEADDDWTPVRLPVEALSRVLLRALLGLGTVAEVRAVRAYVLGTLLGRERAPAAQAVWGLRLLACRPTMRAAVERALVACGLPAYVGLIPLQMTRVGLRAG